MSRRGFASLLLLLVLSGLPLTSARAADPAPCSSATYLDDDQDGRFEALRLSCAYATDHDTITIYPRAATLDPAMDWQHSLDMQQALWLFDADADGGTNLIIEFAREGQALQAMLYDDQDGDGRVGVELKQGRPVVTERAPRMAIPTWSARVTAPDGWWTRNGRVNFNLSVEVDGPVRATFGPELTYSHMLLDGTPDAIIEVADSDRDGVPERDVRCLLMSLPERDGYYRTNIMVNERDQDVPLQYSIVWPYLGSTSAAPRGYGANVTETFKGHDGRGYGIVRDYHENPAPLQIEWNSSKLRYIGEFVASRGGEQQWFVYSLAGAEPNQATATNFESPFAFYDLADDHDGLPELSIRHVYYAPHDPFYSGGDVKHGIRIVRYSWDQDNNRSWDYKLGLISRSAAITDTIALGNITINAIPYDQLPTAMIDQPSDAVTFVAQERAGAWTSEGIYQWDDAPGLSDGYLAGIQSSAPADAFRTIAAGFRGEVNLDLHQPPRLYFSPIDRRLHLLGAAYGITNLGSHGDLHTADSDGDGYLDQWTHTEILSSTPPITRSSQLNHSRSHLIYASGDEVLLREIAVPPSSWQSTPPVDHAEWQRLGERLTAEQAAPADDLQAMIAPFAGFELRISGATMREYRAHGDQFRFVLDLQPGFTLHGDRLLDLAGLAPGSYVVSYDRELHIVPLTAPLLTATLAETSQTEREPSMLNLTIRNDGLQDVTGALLELWAQPPTGTATVVTSDTLSVLGQQSITVKLPWTPKRAGTWTLTPTLQQADQRRVTMEAAHVTVAAQTAVSVPQVLAASASPQTLLAVIIALGTFACTALLVVVRQYEHHDEDETCV